MLLTRADPKFFSDDNRPKAASRSMGLPLSRTHSGRLSMWSAQPLCPPVQARHAKPRCLAYSLPSFGTRYDSTIRPKCRWSKERLHPVGRPNHWVGKSSNEQRDGSRASNLEDRGQAERAARSGDWLCSRVSRRAVSGTIPLLQQSSDDEARQILAERKERPCRFLRAGLSRYRNHERRGCQMQCYAYRILTYKCPLTSCEPYSILRLQSISA